MAFLHFFYEHLFAKFTSVKQSRSYRKSNTSVQEFMNGTYLYHYSKPKKMNSNSEYRNFRTKTYISGCFAELSPRLFSLYRRCYSVASYADNRHTLLNEIKKINIIVARVRTNITPDLEDKRYHNVIYYCDYLCKSLHLKIFRQIIIPDLEHPTLVIITSIMQKKRR